MLRTLRVLTIVQPAALPRAVVLARSLAAEHPDWPLTVLVTASAVPEPTTLPAGTSVVALDTELDHAASEVLTAILEPETLAEAVRGPTLARMLDAGDAALYLDPTFLVTGSLEGIARALGDHEAILIPRPGHPVPRDPRHGPARDRGTFHSGIIALRPGATADAILADWPAADLVESSSGTDVGARRSGFSIWLDALPVRVPGSRTGRSSTHACAGSRRRRSTPGNSPPRCSVRLVRRRSTSGSPSRLPWAPRSASTGTTRPSGRTASISAPPTRISTVQTPKDSRAGSGSTRPRSSRCRPRCCHPAPRTSKTDRHSPPTRCGGSNVSRVLQLRARARRGRAAAHRRARCSRPYRRSRSGGARPSRAASEAEFPLRVTLRRPPYPINDPLHERRHDSRVRA